ncbi:MAG: hypothetical protein LUH02_11040 [Erysipelotrichaceae bacterium]|nr:hypothetical protein [Erysipelotrichaceae bacterium]
MLDVSNNSKNLCCIYKQRNKKFFNVDIKNSIVNLVALQIADIIIINIEKNFIKIKNKLPILGVFRGY